MSTDEKCRVCGHAAHQGSCVNVAPVEPAASTPAATWRVNGEPDPHGNTYDCERAQLAYGSMTDDELANAVYMHDHKTLNVQEVLAGKPSSIALLTAAKDRIRWLSRALIKATAAPSASVPDFDAIRDKRMSEMTPAQRDDALELWIREQIGWMGEYHQRHYEFLLRRLDEARGAKKQEFQD